MKRYILAAVAVVTLFPVGGAQALLVNGDFETGDLTGWTLFTTPNGNLASSGVPGSPGVVSFDTDGDSTATSSAVFSVGRASGISPEEGGGIFQSFNVAAPGLYSVSIDLAVTFNDAAGASNANSGTFSLQIDGAEVDSSPAMSIVSGAEIRDVMTAVVPLTAGLHEFRVLITRPFVSNTIDLAQYLDNASVSAVAEVPLPPSMLLLAAGLGGFGVAARRRRGRARAQR